MIHSTRNSIDRCPRCSQGLLNMNALDGTCASCGLQWRIVGNTLFFGNDEKDTYPPFRNVGWWANKITKAVLARLDPLHSPWSPVSWIAKIRAERYYRRCLMDREYARRFAAHYFSGVDIRAGAKVLDHGCGRGRITAILSQLGCEVVGQDVRRHQWWGQIDAASFVVCPPGFETLSYADGSFDVLINVMVIGHMPPKALEAHFREVNRVLTKGGYYFLLEANSRGYGSHVPRKRYGRLHDLESVQRIAAETNFDVNRIGYEGFYAPIFPIHINTIRKTFNPFTPLRIEDYDSMLARLLPPEKRAVWLLLLRKS